MEQKNKKIHHHFLQKGLKSGLKHKYAKKKQQQQQHIKVGIIWSKSGTTKTT